MSILEQMNRIKKNAKKVQDPALLFAMNKKYKELEEELRNIEVTYKEL